MADSGWSAMRLAPQRTQKLAPSEFRMPHSGQNTSALPGILSGRLVFPRPEAGEDARELLHVVGGDDGLPLLVLVLEAHHEFGVQDVELAPQDAPAARHVALLGLELGDQSAHVVVRSRDAVDDIVHGPSPPRA